MIAVEMDIAAHPDQLPGLQIALLRQHPDEQRRAPQVEGQPQRDIAAALIEQAGETVTRNMELVALVAGGQRHRVQFGDIPAFNDMAAAARIVAQAFHHLGNLVHALCALVKRLPPACS